MVDSSREDELNRALELFHFAFRAFTSNPDRLLEQRGLQRVHHRILYFVGRRTGLSVSELLTTLGITKQALNAPLRQLLEMDLVSSMASPLDRRVRELRLTARGARLEQALSGSQRLLMGRVFEELGDGAEAAWRKIMARIPECTEPPAPSKLPRVRS